MAYYIHHCGKQLSYQNVCISVNNSRYSATYVSLALSLNLLCIYVVQHTTYYVCAKSWGVETRMRL